MFVAATTDDVRHLQVIKYPALGSHLVGTPITLGFLRNVFEPRWIFYFLDLPKAYIDHIVRVGRTFAVINGKFKGLVEGKKILFITARGGEYGAGSPFEGWDAQEPALRFTFQFIGVTDIEFIHANGLDLGEEFRQRGLNEARTKIQDLVINW